MLYLARLDYEVTEEIYLCEKNSFPNAETSGLVRFEGGLLTGIITEVSFRRLSFTAAAWTKNIPVLGFFYLVFFINIFQVTSYNKIYFNLLQSY